MILIALLALLPLAQPQSGAIQGLISRSGTNQPLAKATVEIRGDDDRDLPLYATMTESDGRFLIPNLRPGSYRIVVSRPAYVGRTLSVTVAAGRTDDVQVSLTSTAAISGRVYGPTG